MLIEQLKPAPYNPREIDTKTKQKLKRSIQKFGLVEPLVWNKKTGHVVGGNQRLEVLKELGYKEVEVVEVDLDLQQEQTLNIALNKIQGDWNYEKLKEILIELDLQKIDLEITGFDIEEIEQLLGYAPQVEQIQREKKTIEPFYAILIECENEEQQKTLLKRFNEEGLKCRALIS